MMNRPAVLCFLVGIIFLLREASSHKDDHDDQRKRKGDIRQHGPGGQVRNSRSRSVLPALPGLPELPDPLGGPLGGPLVGPQQLIMFGLTDARQSQQGPRRIPQRDPPTLLQPQAVTPPPPPTTPPPPPPPPPSPSSISDMEGLTSRKGYKLERHEVVTGDGYKIVNFRIPRGRFSRSSSNPGAPVLLVHGISLSSTCWVVNQPDESLAFILADRGYDVWMMNTRGNTFSRGHTRYSDADPRYWAFSIDEMALYDLPATIDYVLQLTGHKRVSLIGHSQGGTLALMLLSHRTEYNDKVNVNIGLAPVIYVKYITSQTMVSFCKAANASAAISLLPPQEYAPMSQTAQSLFLAGTCQTLVTAQICVGVTAGMFGPSSHIRTMQYRSYFLVWPSSTSFWNALHWAQLYNEPEPHLRAFNYGPEYDLGLVKSPTVFLTGGTDVLAPPQSFDEAAKHLGASLVETHQIQGYSHMDFIWDAYGAKNEVYPQVLKALEKHALSS